MKESPKGPFIRVFWFCNDGEILLPKPYACTEHGGGYQHGKLNDRALILRNNGYWIANLLAGIDTKNILASDDFVDWYGQLLIEKFLIRTDNGWILKKALYYRGAIQEEDERYGARMLLTALAEKNEWIKRRYSALRTGVQLLPHGEDSASIQKVRQMSVSLAEQDEQFVNLRTKIHVSPDAGDARLVREYAAKISDPQQQAKYMELAQEIDRVFQSHPLHQLLERNAKIFSAEPWLQQLLLEAGKAYHSDNSAGNYYAVTSHLLADLRDALPKIRKPGSRLRILDLSLAVEVENFRVSTQLKSTLTKVNRLQRISWLRDAALAAYGTGHINHRSLEALQASISRMEYAQLPLTTYFNELKYLSRAPGWSTQELRFQFYQSMIKLTEIEPLAIFFIQDILRGSPMLFFSQILDSLSRDANQLAGTTHKIFNTQVGVGFHALNPGLARGKLYTKVDINNSANFDSQGIYLLPETVADLPSIAGIITVGEGNSLSHIQLLARNLGIPNITVNENLLQQLQDHDGETIVMAVSPDGLIEINGDSEYWQKFFNSNSNQQQAVIRPDLEKLDLSIQEIIGLNSLRASDSGRIVGPKAAKLGELYYHYPGKVAKGFAIPFGVFRKTVLDAPYKKTEQTVFEWMESQYAIIHALPIDSEQRKQMTESYRAEIYDIIINTDIGDQNRNNIRKAMINTFGSTEAGVFIRSDTNVEDLPGFTGAGLNLTLFNIVSIENIFKGITKVWASPFTARAFSWRQSLMESPQHVYPSILLMQTVANDKSGVMITEDIDTNKKGVLYIATNEGVGGAVDGQSAESLRIDTRDGKVLLLATASAPFRKVPLPEGGIANVPVSDSESVLKANEISQLIQFAKELPDTFPPITDENNNPVPADIEFGFFNGKLQLFQLRPFLQSNKVQASSYLMNMDKALQNNMNRMVLMNEVPEEL
ncbi:hypothetical protein AU255_04890 [Methyloprofundus sedimenti]|uniref:Phosphoenolpyruvate synthase n=1 Tax=Methyloprofundus sedimenti TaxID=1420851 RepID=A0A1V8M6R5_9GAMM|nr:PEP/pyruvate-binding domain-containing protein [Methyloprofundus sedimenti]OQK17232.1 hypothetical protein AU255_04890 [Methyloprofundus sedimenti]